MNNSVNHGMDHGNLVVGANIQNGDVNTQNGANGSTDTSTDTSQKSTATATTTTTTTQSNVEDGTDSSITSELAGNWVIDWGAFAEPESMCLKEVINNYTIPQRLQRSSSAKAKKAKFEEVVPGQYQAGAHCATFRTSRCRLFAWIKACWLVYYDTIGEQGNAKVRWDEEGGNVIIQVSKNESDSNTLYSLTIFLTTGLLMIQGREFLAWIHRDLPYLIALVNRIEAAETNQVDQLHT
jgi:hypothetical protein